MHEQNLLRKNIAQLMAGPYLRLGEEGGRPKPQKLSLKFRPQNKIKKSIY
jgi:hypothetical protein